MSFLWSVWAAEGYVWSSILFSKGCASSLFFYHWGLSRKLSGRVSLTLLMLLGHRKGANCLECLPSGVFLSLCND